MFVILSWLISSNHQANEYGQLTIIDRKSNLVKIQSSYYVILAKIDAVLKGCRLVENIAVHANPYYDYVTAIVSPNEANICKLAEMLGKNTVDLSRLYGDEDLENAVVDELAKFGLANGLIAMEIPAYVKLVREKWTPLNGLLTETLKTRRKRVVS